VQLSGVDLIDLRWGDRGIAQRIYVAVRDAPWNTIPAVVLAREISQGDDNFTVTFRCRHRFGEIDFEWNGVVEGSADGTLSYRLSGQALSGFEYSKIGLNVHHPLGEYRECSYEATTESGKSLTGRLPSAIEPQLIRDGILTAMFDEFRQITFDLDGLRAEFAFEGDDFEMQDHRNWADANYKTYGTSLKRGFPFTAHRGDRFEQGVVVTLSGALGMPPPTVAPTVPDLGFWEQAASFPQLGQLWVSPPAPDAYERPPSSRPDFLRLEVDEVANVFAALEETRAAFPHDPVAIELVLKTTPSNATEDARALAATLADTRISSAAGPAFVPVLRVIVLERTTGFSATKLATPAGLVSDFVTAIRAAGSTLPVQSGSEQNFNEINRSRPNYKGLNGIAFAYNPQVHAADNQSLMQNAATILDIAESTRALYPGVALSVGPVRLLGPDGPYPAGPIAPGESPNTVDERQRGLFGGAWTVAFLRSCVAASVEAVTLFSLTGEGGIIGTPIGWVFERLRESPPVSSSRVFVSGPVDGHLAGIRWTTAIGSRTLIANLRDTPAVVNSTALYSGVPSRSVTMRLFDEPVTPADFDAVEGSVFSEASPPRNSTTMLTPFAVLCIDESAGPEAS
jgi:hypothetical protein